MNPVAAGFDDLSDTSDFFLDAFNRPIPKRCNYVWPGDESAPKVMMGRHEFDGTYWRKLYAKSPTQEDKTPSPSIEGRSSTATSESLLELSL